MAIDWGDTDAECIAFDETYGIEFPTISGIEGGGNAIFNTYGVQYAPTYILIAPNHDILIPVIWPVPGTQTFIDAFEPHGLEPIVSLEPFEGTCFNWPAFELTGGLPEGGDYSGPGVTDGIFDPGEAGVGTHTIIYTYVSDEGCENSVEENIEVFELPDVTLEAFESACIFWVPYELIGGTPEGGEYSGPGVTDGMFDPEAAGLGTHTITYNYVSEDGCENLAEETLYVDACTGIDEIVEDAVQVYPNPTNDIVHISSESNMVSVSIYNYTGQLMESLKLNESSYQINTSSFPMGVYSIKIETEDNIITKRLIIK